MIEVIYYKEHNRLTVQGHAKSDEYGRDLVCASASILAVTLGCNVGHLEEGGVVTDVSVRLDPGNAEISCKPKTRFRNVVKQTFQSVCVGFEILASKYPEYISFTVRGW